MFHKTKKLFLGIIAVVVAVGILGFFYQYSERSSASTIEIPVEFSRSELLIGSESANNYVEINLRAGTNRLSGATALLSYPKDIVTATIDSTNCKGLDSNVTTKVNATDGTITIVRVSVIDNDDGLPTGLVCFARINFEPIVADGSGTLTFIDGPVENRSWEIVGPNNSYTAKHDKNQIAITVTGVTPIPTATPTPTIDPNATLTPTPTATPISPTNTPIPPITTPIPPTNTPAQTTPGTGVTSNITFDIRTQGLTEAAKKVNEIPVRVVFLKDETVIDERTVSMSKNGDGTWTGTSAYDSLLTGTNYTLLIKGPKHLQKKICANKPSESIAGQYSCADGVIRIQTGDNRLDLKGVTLLAGDLPLQNGIVDAVDIAYIRSNLGKTDAEVVSRGDLNYDGIVDSQDYGIIINALSFKYDEEE